ncbi:hypothetical protein M0805_008348 [Coniferiporia weirii]|nr:hypothetical protein M0805_008348 [Coniferiporia weirii]
MSAQAAPFGAGAPTRHVPTKSSPLAAAPATFKSGSTAGGMFPKPAVLRAHNFPTSRPLRPFASIAPKASAKPVKIIELPESFKSGIFVLNLTQAEFSRQD